jgi:hypothetical protein
MSHSTLELADTSTESTAMITREFITAGRSTFTVEIPHDFASRNDLPHHYTFQVRKPPADQNFSMFLVFFLTGPDNQHDYNYMGCLKQNGELRITQKSCMKTDSWPFKILSRVLARIWEGNTGAIEFAGWNVHHEGRCGKCGRMLTDPDSIRIGIGPHCRGDK